MTFVLSSVEMPNEKQEVHRVHDRWKKYLATTETFYSYPSKSQYVTFELTVIKAFRISLINDKMVFNR